MSQVFVGYGSHGVEGVDEEYIRFVFDVVLGSLNRSADCEVGLVLANKDDVQKLNHKYRGKDKPTNVLSFANQEIPDLPDKPELQDEQYLGDIYVCYQILLNEAEKLKIPPREHFARLFIHGLLHLAGYDHEKFLDTAKMEAMEDKILELVA